MTIGERRSGSDRHDPLAPPSTEQLALFARRLRRAMRDDKSRCHFGVANGEQDFVLYPDVVRAVEWIERLGAAEAGHGVQSALKKRAPDAADLSVKAAAADH